MPRIVPATPRGRFLFAALAVTLLALGLRLHGLDRESLFHDEMAQVGTYGGSMGEILLRAADHPQPPLDYWIGSLVGRPESDALVRLPSALFGAGSVLLLMLLAARALPAPAALLAGLALALLPFSLYYSQHARPYSIVIFFTLATLLALDRALRREKASWGSFVALFFCASAFLWSRTFDPMMAVVALTGLLAARVAAGARAEGLWRHEGQRRRLLAAAALGAALLAFLPLFRLLLERGSARGWAGTHGLDPFALLAKGIASFTLVPMWRSYLAQADPLGPLLLPFVLAAPLLALALGEWRRDPALFFVPLLLPATAVAETLAFGATADFAIWRPPFPAWMLPLALLSATATIFFLWRLAGGRASAVRPVLAAFVVLLLLLCGRSALAFKGSLKNDDWRGVGSWLSQNTGAGQIIIFAGAVPNYGWEPTFYGFPRYYRGKARLLPLEEVAGLAPRMAGLKLEPVVVVFHYRNFFLTPQSPVPVITNPGGDPDVGTGTLAIDPALVVRSFPSFSVVRLRQGKGDLAADTYTALERIIADLPPGGHLGRMHLAAAFLGRSLGAPSWEGHRALAAQAFAGDGRYTARLDLLKAR